MPRRSFHFPTAYLIPGMSIVLGVAFLVHGLMIPEYSVPNGRDLLFNSSWQERELRSGNPGQLEQEWDTLSGKIATRHFAYCDLAYSFLGVGVSVFVLFLIDRIRDIGDVRNMRTPTTHARFYIFAIVVWLSYIPAQVFFISYIDARNDPPFIDNMAGPIGSTLTILFGLAGLPFILFGVWILIHGKALPVVLRSGRNGRPLSLLTVAVWIALVLSVLVTVGCFISEPPLVPSCVFTVYLLLSGRSMAAIPAHA